MEYLASLGITPLILVLIIAGTGMLIYTAVRWFDQNRYLVFKAPTKPSSFIIFVLFCVIALVNYFSRGKTFQEFWVGYLLVSFAISILLVRDGVGASGIYSEGIKYAWKDITAAQVSKRQNRVYVMVRVGKATRGVTLKFADEDKIREYVGQHARLVGGDRELPSA